MTVSELIELLSKVPQDLPVYINNPDWGPLPLREGPKVLEVDYETLDGDFFEGTAVVLWG